MNKKEKMAACILVFTLAAGILVDLLQDRLRAGRNEAGGAPAGAAEEMGGSVGAGVDSLPSGDPEAAPAARAADADRSGNGSDYRRIDINRAGLEELELLPGIGPKKAEAIVRWRSEHGRFGRVEDLLEVKGIGRATLERIKPFAEVSK